MPYSRCRACGFRLANPVPPDEVISAFYNSPFYSNYRRLEENRIANGNYFSVSIDTGLMRHLATWLGEDRSLKILDYAAVLERLLRCYVASSAFRMLMDSSLTAKV